MVVADPDFRPHHAPLSDAVIDQPGYGEPEKHFPRSPRLPFDEACRIE